ncbi:hypothetical protein E4U30_000386 [Claviceps sp. LM220 group G6]|nr:hypothetical protein E4U30_000386 [Claviceps sp. LM220 group G6]
MDVLVLSWEDDHEDRPRPSDEDYKTLYEYAISELNTTLRSKDRWATRFSAYDTLTLRPRSGREADEEVRTTSAATTNTLSRAAEKEDEEALSSDT